MNSLSSLIREGAKRLKEAGISSAALDARVLLSYVTSYSPEELILRGSEPIYHDHKALTPPLSPSSLPSSLSIPSSRRRPGPSPTNDSPKGSSFIEYHPLGGIFVGLGPGLRRDDGSGRDDGRGGDNVERREIAKKFFKLIARRGKREPIAYITGQKEFYGINFTVNKNVLIPRPDSETVIELAKSYFSPETELSILDLGTGSGCLALTLLTVFPGAKATAVDVSDKALRVAKKNAYILGLTNRSRFIKSDWTNLKLKSKFDIVISNPPYITNQDIDSLQQDVKDYEPHLALAGGKDGLDCYRAIFVNLQNFLKPNGICIFEIGAGQSEEISKIADCYGFRLHKSKKDLSGIIRAVSFVLSGSGKI